MKYYNWIALAGTIAILAGMALKLKETKQADMFLVMICYFIANLILFCKE